MDLDKLTTYYAILQWTGTEWKVLHYTHDIDDFQRHQVKFPETNSVIHMINVKYCASHDFLEKCKAYRTKKD